MCLSVLWIRIRARIQNFLQDPDPDLEVMDPDPELEVMDPDPATDPELD
jgi:hypothetical protein